MFQFVHFHFSLYMFFLLLLLPVYALNMEIRLNGFSMYVWCKQGKKRINCFISLERGEYIIFHCDGEHMMMMICVKNKTNEALNGNSCWLIDTSMYYICVYFCLFITPSMQVIEMASFAVLTFPVKTMRTREKQKTHTHLEWEKNHSQLLSILYIQ